MRLKREPGGSCQEAGHKEWLKPSYSSSPMTVTLDQCHGIPEEAVGQFMILAGFREPQEDVISIVAVCAPHKSEPCHNHVLIYLYFWLRRLI
jgi:hypothetical protein